MSTKDQKPESKQDELSEEQLDGIAGGQEVRKMETIVVTAKRETPAPQVVKMETIVVTAKRSDLPTQVATADTTTKKTN